MKKEIFQTTKLKNVTLKNRIMRSATWEALATDNGHLTDELIKVHEQLAENEVGLIITGYANVLASEQPNARMMGIYDDSFITEYQDLCKLVHQYDCAIVLQLAYGGTKTTYNVGERIIYAPSAIAERQTQTMGKAMTKEEIQEVVLAFGQGARRAYLSGFDGVEIHGAHTYLIAQFLSPYYNQRSDEYGGSLENRLRFLKEIYAEVRKQTSEDYLVMVKISASEFFEAGMHFDEVKVICQELAKMGFDVLDISGNIHGKASRMAGEVFDKITLRKEGYFVNYAAIIAEMVDIPVLTMGGFKSVSAIEEVLTNTEISYIGMARPLFSDPDLIKRWKNGEVDYVSRCISCSKCRTSHGNYCTIFNPNNY